MPAQPPETRASLLLRIRDPEDSLAWQEFQELYEPLVYRLARVRGLQDADARELSQEVLWAVARSIDRFEPDPARGSFRGWLATIARNLVVNFLVRQKRHARGSGDSDVRRLLEAVPAPDQEASATFDFEFRRETFLWAARKARPHFQPKTWDAFWKTCVEGRDVAEVAAELNLTAGAVYVCRSRVMARLRKLVDSISRESPSW